MDSAPRTKGSRVRSRVRHLAPSVAFVVGVALLMELLTRVGVLNPITLPPPSRVVSTLVEEVSEGDLVIDLFLTIERAIIGLFLAIVVTVPLGAIVGRFRVIGQYVNPVVELLRPIPTPVYLPLAAVLAGYGTVPKVAVIFVGASFPVLLMTMQGVEAIDPGLERSARSLGYSRPAMVFKVLAPAAAPSIAAGVRTSLSLALLISTVADMVISFNGLGHYLVAAQLRIQFPKVAAGLLALAIGAFFLNVLAERLQRRIMPWHFGRTAQG